MTTPACSVCFNDQTSDLLTVTDRATGHTRHVCRSSVSPRCFLTIRDRSVETIRLLAPPGAAEVATWQARRDAEERRRAAERPPRTSDGGTAGGKMSDPAGVDHASRVPTGGPR